MGVIHAKTVRKKMKLYVIGEAYLTFKKKHECFDHAVPVTVAASCITHADDRTETKN
jgi:hypothetical protein